MDTAIKCINQIIEIVDQANSEYRALSGQLSSLDLETQDLLHFLENETFNVVRGYYLAKQLKDIRIKRRAIKKDLELFQILINSLDSIDFKKINQKLYKKIENRENYTYTPRILKKDD